MTQLKWLVVLVVAALAWSASAAAQEVSLEKKDRGVLGTMQRMHCSPSWLSVVMQDSNIREADLRRLRIGTPIRLPEECEKKLPAQADIQLSKEILARDLRKGHRHEVVRVSASAPQQLRRERVGSAAVAPRSASPRNQVGGRNKETVLGKPSAENQHQGFGTILSFVMGLGVGVVACGLVIGFFFVKKIRRLERDLRRSRIGGISSSGVQRVEDGSEVFNFTFPASIDFHGAKVRFKNTTAYTVGCPYCSEKGITPNAHTMREHLVGHTSLRSVEKKPSELWRMLETLDEPEHLNTSS